MSRIKRRLLSLLLVLTMVVSMLSIGVSAETATEDSSTTGTVVVDDDFSDRILNANWIDAPSTTRGHFRLTDSGTLQYYEDTSDNPSSVPSDSAGTVYYSGLQMKDYELSFDLKTAGDVGGNWFYILLNTTNGNVGYNIRLRDLGSNEGHLRAGSESSGYLQSMSSANTTAIYDGQWHSITISVIGNNIAMYDGDKEVLNYTDATGAVAARTLGTFGFCFENVNYEIDNVKVTCYDSGAAGIPEENVVLSEDFTTMPSDWTDVSNSYAITDDGALQYTQAVAQSRFYYNGGNWNDFELRFDVKMPATGSGNWFRVNLHTAPSTMPYYVYFQGFNTTVTLRDTTTLDTSSSMSSLWDGQWHQIRVTVSTDALSAYADDVLLVSADISGLSDLSKSFSFSCTGAAYEFDNVEVVLQDQEQEEPEEEEIDGVVLNDDFSGRVLDPNWVVNSSRPYTLSADGTLAYNQTSGAVVYYSGLAMENYQLTFDVKASGSWFDVILNETNGSVSDTTDWRFRFAGFGNKYLLSYNPVESGAQRGSAASLYDSQWHTVTILVEGDTVTISYDSTNITYQKTALTTRTLGSIAFHCQGEFEFDNVKVICYDEDVEEKPVVLQEDFTTKPSDWVDSGSSYKVTADGALQFDNVNGTNGNVIYYNYGYWNDFELSFDVKTPASGSGSWLQVKLFTPSGSAMSQYIYFKGFSGKVMIQGSGAQTADSTASIWDGGWHHIRIRVVGNTITVYNGNTQLATASGAAYATDACSVGFAVSGTSEYTYEFDNVRVISHDWADKKGKVVLNEDFADADTAPNWTIRDSNCGNYAYSGGKLVHTLGENASTAGTGATTIYNAGSWMHSEVSVDVQFPQLKTGNWFQIGLRAVYGENNGGNGIRFYNLSGGTSMRILIGSTQIQQTEFDYCASISKYFDGQVHNVRIQLVGKTMRAYVDDELIVMETNDAFTSVRGGAAFVSYVDGQTFDNVKIVSFDGYAPSELYVSPNGNDANPGTQDAPIQSFALAAYLAKPGTTVHFLDGTYNESQITVMHNSGTQDAPIVYKAENPGNVFVVYSDDMTVGDKIRISNREYITIQGLNVSQAVRATEDTSGNNLDVLIRCSRSNNISFIGNTLHNAFEEPLKIYLCNGILVDGNTIYESGNEGIDIVNVSDSIIRNNTIYEVGRCALMCKGGSRSIQFYGNTITHSSTSTKNPQKAFDFGGGTDNVSTWSSANGAYEAYNILFFNNIIEGGFTYGISFIGAKDCAAYNNVVNGVEYAVNFQTANDMNFQWEWNPITINPVLKNNIFINCTAADVYKYTNQPTNLISDYNLFYGNAGTAPVESHSIYADPMLGSDYRPLENSPVIGAGTAIDGFTNYSGQNFVLSFDKDYLLRGSTWDMGCYDVDATEAYAPGGILYQNFVNVIVPAMPPQGTTVLSEDFSQTADLEQWITTGSWAIDNESLAGSGFAGLSDGLGWSDVRFSSNVQAPSQANGPASGILFRADETLQNMYGFRFYPGESTDRMELCKWTNGQCATLKVFAFSWTPGQVYNLQVTASGDDFAFYVDGTQVGVCSDRSFASGTVGLYSQQESRSFDDLIVKSARGITINTAEDFPPVYTGTTLCAEDFASGNLSDWTVIGGTWAVTDGVLNSTTTKAHLVYNAGSAWTNYEFSADVLIPASGGMWAGMIFHAAVSDGKVTQGFGFRFVNDDLQVVMAAGNGGWTTIGQKAMASIPKGQMATLKVIVEDGGFRLYLNGTKIWEETRYTLPGGTIGLFSENMAASFDNIVVKEIADLT